jgi:hypothetical protein
VLPVVVWVLSQIPPGEFEGYSEIASPDWSFGSLYHVGRERVK